MAQRSEAFKYYMRKMEEWKEHYGFDYDHPERILVRDGMICDINGDPVPGDFYDPVPDEEAIILMEEMTNEEVGLIITEHERSIKFSNARIAGLKRRTM